MCFKNCLPLLEDKKGKGCPSSHTEWLSPDVSYQGSVWDKRLWAHIPKRTKRERYLVDQTPLSLIAS